MPFYPFGPPPEVPGRNTTGRDQPGNAERDQAAQIIISMAKAHGIIPPFVPDDQIMLVKTNMTTGEMEFAGSPGARQADVTEWRAGDVLPHTARDFSDPPFMQTPEEWKNKLAGAVNDCDDQEEFRYLLIASLGYDMTHSHGVPPELAADGAAEFADWLYGEFRDADRR